MGELQDSNSAYLAAQLPSFGLEVLRITLVGDDIKQYGEVLFRAWQRADFTFTTGGLGPTKDDVTRETIAQVFQQEIFTDHQLVDDLKNIFRARGTEMPAHNLKQAGLIDGAIGIPNRMGTAPGWWAEKNGHVIVALPGPPNELQHMWENEIAVRLRSRVKGKVILTRTLKTIGLAEAAVDEMIRDLLGLENPYLGIYAKPDGIHLRIIAKASTNAGALDLIRPIEAQIRTVFKGSIWGSDSETIEGSLGLLLTERGLTVATMESCTGGMLASKLTDVPGSSRYFMGSVVAYTNDLKIASGVPAQLIKKHGAVSGQVAEAMAEAARLRLGADFGVGVTGVTGPEAMDGQIPGTVYVGVAQQGKTHSVHNRFPPYNRGLIKRRATMAALLALRNTFDIPQ